MGHDGQDSTKNNTINNYVYSVLVPEERRAADRNLNAICFELICNEEYELAKILLEFATTTLKQYSSEDARLTFMINKAQAIKWSGNTEACNQIIAEIDWSACSDKFKLVSNTLIEDYDTAAKIMRKLGINDDISKIDYKNWPVFKEFRKTEQFFKTYEGTFKESYVVSEAPRRTVIELIEELNKKLEQSKNSEGEADLS